MRAAEIIRQKRDGETLSPEAIGSMVAAATAFSQGKPTEWEKYQLSALLMAIWLKGMSPEETATLTKSMTNSGQRFRWDSIPGPKVDKHSTGGVGDKTSLILAPLVAACGGIVPMMSGRGLGHSGGTLDKLESIPGFRVGLDEAELKRCLEKIGVGLIGQTANVAPADKFLYSMRDVTATVESIPLITASILSKKLAEGIDGLVMDVKCGVGAFMKSFSQAKALAESIVSVGNANGVRTIALITAMNAPLGYYVGNSLEVIESIQVLKGEAHGDLEDLSVRLAATMLVLGGPDPSMAIAEERIRGAIRSGAGLEKFRQIIEMQGGDPRVIDDPKRLPTAPHRYAIKSRMSGNVGGLHAEKIGVAALLLGAGRKRAEDGIWHDVGIVIRKQIGETVRSGDTILEVHYRDEPRLAEALPLLESAITIVEGPPTLSPLIYDQIGEL